MKHITLGLTPTTPAIHPVDQRLATHDAVTRESILHLDFRGDDLTILYQLTGNRTVAARELEMEETVTDFELVDDEDGFSAYIRASAPDSGGDLLDIADEHALIVETPIDVTANGPEMMLVGTHDALRGAMEAIPDDLTTTVLNAGPYTPSTSSLLTELTERQLEVFQVAVEEGYYDLPRRTTHKQLADELGCAPSTIDEHLRKAESRVVSGILG